MHRRQPRPLIRAQLEGSIHHAEWFKNHPRQMRAKRLAGCGLDHLAGPIYADAIGPILTGIEQKRQGKRCIAAGANRWRSSGLAEARDVSAPHVIGIAGCMGQQMAQGDRALGGAHFGLPGLIKAFQHAKRADFRHQSGGGRIQGKLARFHQHHRRHAGNRLGHGSNPEHAIGRHGLSPAQGTAAKAGFQSRAMPIAQRQHHARDFPGLDGFLHPNCDILLPVHACCFPCHPAALPCCSSPRRRHVFIVPRLETRR